MKNNLSIKSISQFLIGKDTDFEPEHRFLNIICLFIAVAYFITLPINFILSLSLATTLINLFVSVMVFILYFLARFKKKVVLATSLMLASVFISLTIDWFLNGGISGGVSYYFFSLLVVILFLFNGISRVILSLLLVMDVGALFIIEYFNPGLITTYSSRHQMFFDHFANFIIAGPFIILAVYFSKQLYLKEKQNTITIIENYRKNSEYLKKQMDEKFKVLSIREREILKLIIEGKSNKEIADQLFISIETVKKHINTLFKKIGARKRVDLIDSYNSKG
jgi:DNA-binding CsgD family transcriptional regulator